MNFKMLKSINWLAKEVHQLQDKILIPPLKKYWPEKISPNILSVIRLICALFILLMLCQGYNFHRAKIISFFLFAALLDFIDGPISRALDKQSLFGALLDPLSDKILICPLLIFLVWPYSHFLVVCIIVMELILAGLGLAGFIKKDQLNIIIGATIWGKWKMASEVIAFAFFLFNGIEAGINLLWISFGFGLSSIFGHLQPYIAYILKPINQ